MATQETLIEATGLCKSFGPNVAVANLNLQLQQGEVLGLLGPNGAGKSTSMKMLTGNLAPSEGDIRIKGISMRNDPVGAKRQLGYLPEQPPVYPELNVDEYLRFCAGLHGLRGSKASQAMSSVKRDCGLEDVGRRLIGNLSKGFQQRVGIAQAILHRPPVVILDEPTVGLDPIQIREIRDLIRRLGENHSVILSSHILPEIQAICDRVLIIHRGQTVYDAAIDAHLAQMTLMVEFGRSPTLAELKALEGVDAVTQAGELRFQIQVSQGGDPRSELVAMSVAQAWDLKELRLDSQTLEEIFVQRTSAENLQEAA